MENQGYVSLWIGKIQNKDKLFDYTKMNYTEDGDVIPSDFLNDFSIDIDDYEEDFIERIVYDNNGIYTFKYIGNVTYE